MTPQYKTKRTRSAHRRLGKVEKALPKWFGSESSVRLRVGCSSITRSNVLTVWLIRMFTATTKKYCLPCTILKIIWYLSWTYLCHWTLRQQGWWIMNQQKSYIHVRASICTTYFRCCDTNNQGAKASWTGKYITLGGKERIVSVLEIIYSRYTNRVQVLESLSPFVTNYLLRIYTDTLKQLIISHFISYEWFEYFVPLFKNPCAWRSSTWPLIWKTSGGWNYTELLCLSFAEQ